MVVSKRWFEFPGGTEFRYRLPPFYLNFTPFLPQFNLFLPLFYINLTSASSRISSHGLETTVYRLLEILVKFSVCYVSEVWVSESEISWAAPTVSYLWPTRTELSRKVSENRKFLGRNISVICPGSCCVTGMSREFCRDVPDPWQCSKSLCKKTSCSFFVPQCGCSDI